MHQFNTITTFSFKCFFVFSDLKYTKINRESWIKQHFQKPGASKEYLKINCDAYLYIIITNHLAAFRLPQSFIVLTVSHLLYFTYELWLMIF